MKIINCYCYAYIWTCQLNDIKDILDNPIYIDNMKFIEVIYE